MDKKNIDWQNIGFQYHKTDFRFIARHENGSWNKGELTDDNYIHLHEGSGSIHYAHQCFEGLKAYSSPEGKILLFRPLENARRMQKTARRLIIPEVPDELFLRAIKETVYANKKWIPPYGTGASLYIRPVLFASGKMLGLTPAPSYEFRVFVSPVGPYFSSQKFQPIKLYLTTEFDRAAPNGIGSYKAGANYASGFYTKKIAQEKGASDVLFLDAKNQQYLDETGAANIIILTKDNQLISPNSKSILPSITRRSILEIAKKKLNLEIVEREINFFDEIENFAEVGICGTAAVLTPISEIISDEKNYQFLAGFEKMEKLYRELLAIQQGEKEDIFNWVLNLEKK